LEELAGEHQMPQTTYLLTEMMLLSNPTMTMICLRIMMQEMTLSMVKMILRTTQIPNGKPGRTFPQKPRPIVE
jgi:hypothetical protein